KPRSGPVAEFWNPTGVAVLVAGLGAGASMAPADALRDGELDGTRILSPQATAAIRQITVHGRRYDLGLGWLRSAGQRNADPPLVEHRFAGSRFQSLVLPPPMPVPGDLDRASEAQDERAAGLTVDPCPERTADLPEY